MTNARPRNASRDEARPAIFLDRDGTVIEQVHYIGDPELVRLTPGAGPALRRLADAGFALVVVSNQAAIGKGVITQAQYDAVETRMAERLAEHGVRLTASYHCPKPGCGSDRMVIEQHDRKPGPGMLLQAAAEHRLDLARSWMVGDKLDDMRFARNAGLRGVLVETGHGADEITRFAGARWFDVRPSLVEAASLILEEA